MNTEPKIFANSKCFKLAESPMWHKRQQALYWRGYHGEIYRKRTPENPDDFECFQLDIGKIGSMVFTPTDEILLFAEGARVWRWVPYGEPVLLFDFKGNIFNDMLCDSRGRIYCGMLAENFFDRPNRGKHGSFWRLDPSGEMTCLDSNISPTPNGIRISPANDKLYFAVTDDNTVYRYDYDVETGALSHKAVFANDCRPDGMAIDATGNLWVADCRPDGGVVCYDPPGTVIRRVHVPANRTMSVAFGGADGKTVFVTTGCASTGQVGFDGGVFAFRTDIPGAAEYLFPLS